MDTFLGKPIAIWIAILHLLNEANISDDDIAKGNVKIRRVSFQEFMAKQLKTKQESNES